MGQHAVEAQRREQQAVFPVLISRDGKSYVYSYRRWTEDLYLAEGLRER